MNSTPPGLRLVCGLPFYFTLSSFGVWKLNFARGFLSVLVAGRSGLAKGLCVGQEQFRECSSRSVCSAGCVVITLVFHFLKHFSEGI